MNTTEDQAQQRKKPEKEDHLRTPCTSWRHEYKIMFYFPVDLVTCYPVFHIYPSFFHPPQFLSTPRVSSPPRICLVGFYSTPRVAPPPPIPLDTATEDARRCLLSSCSSSCHLIMIRSVVSGTPRRHLHACRFLLQWTTERSQLRTASGYVPLTLRWLETP